MTAADTDRARFLMMCAGGISPPANTVAPAVTPTVGVIGGDTLTTTLGTWTGSPTLTRQWQFSANGTTGWTSSPSATAATWGAPAGYYAACLVTGTNAAGAVSVRSNVVFCEDPS